MRIHKAYTISSSIILQQLLQLSKEYSHCCLFVSNGSSEGFDYLMALDVDAELISNTNSFEELKNFYESQKEYVFGHFSYNLKNQLEKLSSKHIDAHVFSDSYFFVPKFLLKIIGNKTEISAEEKYLNELDKIAEKLTQETTGFSAEQQVMSINAQTTKEEYIKTVEQIKQHIQRGDIYITNYCINFYSQDVTINPEQLFYTLNTIAQSPFAALYKVNERYTLSASPERFIHKRDDKIISQPIKGTRKRGKTEQEDHYLKAELATSLKEQNENVMIVDLVRNDLSRSAQKGSVHVEELFGVYSFPTVHQMISTISNKLNPKVHFIDAIKYAFPMGSMTGAPKVKAMQLMDTFENFNRGLYAGSIGYITPSGDFDFNVVIRSILYSADKKYLSFAVGSAITNKCKAEEEYDECLLKAEAMLKVLNAKLEVDN